MPRRLPGKPLLFALCLVPLLWFGGRIYVGALGPDPGKEIVLFTGTWGLNLLLLTLAVSPVRAWLRQPQWLRYRRMLGLFCFFYATLHVLCVGTYIIGWQWGVLTEELRERPYMLAGFAAWLTLLPLALTSNRYSVRKLGRRWASLHRLVYLTLALALVHLLWLIRSSYLEAAFYSLAALFLLYWRLPGRFRPSRSA